MGKVAGATGAENAPTWGVAAGMNPWARVGAIGTYARDDSWPKYITAHSTTAERKPAENDFTTTDIVTQRNSIEP